MRTAGAMPAKTRFVLFVALVVFCPMEVAAGDLRQQASINLLTKHHPSMPAESPTAKGNSTPTCPPPPKTDKWSFMGDASVMTQIVFWVGTTGIVVTVLVTVALCCCSCSAGHERSRRQRERESLAMLREPLIPPPSISGLDQRERRSSVRPLVVSTQTRSGRGISSTSVTYATVYPRTLPTGPAQDRMDTGTGVGTGVGRGAQSHGTFQIMSPSLVPHNAGVQDYGYHDREPQAYFPGLPSYNSNPAPVNNRQPQAATAQQGGPTAVPRSPPPPYPFDHC